MDILDLHRVLVDLCLPDGGELVQRETHTQKLHDGSQLVAVLGVMEVTWEGEGRGGRGGRGEGERVCDRVYAFVTDYVCVR